MVPVSIIRRDGYIEWTNHAFSKMCNVDITYNLPLSDYIENFDINDYVTETKNDNDTKIVYKIQHNSRIYRVYGDFIFLNKSKSDDYYIVLYWYDYTKYNQLKTQYYQEAFVSCIIVIDNYDEVMQSTENADRPQLTAFMEEALDSVAQDAHGILKKYEKDRFFLYVQKKYLDILIKNSFSFVESFKNILAGNKVAPTLSVGIGTDGESLIQNDTFAYSALDMALGRGGDQVVIKDKEQYHFYGGKTKEVEKRTRVKARVVSQAMREIILSSNEIIIMGHKYADVDVLGSAIGLYAIIRSLNKKAKILCDLTEEESRFLSTIQVGVTLAGFFSSAVAADNLTEYVVYWLRDTGLPTASLRAISLVIITLLLSFITLIFGELVPKRIAMNDPEKTSFFAAYPLKF